MFNSKKKQQKLLDSIGMIKPTSKAALKQQCLYLCNLNVDEANKMYDFLIKDIGDSIPDIDPAQKSFVQNVGDSTKSILGWFKENQDVLSQVSNMIKGLITKGSGTPEVNALPPINAE